MVSDIILSFFQGDFNFIVLSSFPICPVIPGIIQVILLKWVCLQPKRDGMPLGLILMGRLQGLFAAKGGGSHKVFDKKKPWHISPQA
jgi:hypothetical protein